MSLRTPVCLLLVTGALAASVAGCAGPPYDCWMTLTCDPPPVPVVTISDACQDECAPAVAVSNGWTERPVLLWTSAMNEIPPPCPGNAQIDGFLGYADPLDDFVCTTCACEPPAGSCALPATVTASAAKCSGISDTTVVTAFDPPVPWDGSCTTHDALAAKLPCGAEDCVQSLTIAALTLEEAGCVPKQPVITSKVTPSKLAKVCEGNTTGRCTGTEVCAPRASPRFQQCVMQRADVPACPSEYPERHVFYGDAVDTRGCTPCTCQPPQGSTCSSLISFFTDDACSTAAHLDSNTVDATTSSCTDVPSGSPLGSKSATSPIYAPGACEPAGGTPTGTVELIEPATFCCRP